MLLDTSGLLCYLHFDESKHQETVQFLDNYDGKLLTHNYVLAELVALAIARRFPRSSVLDFLSDLPKSEWKAPSFSYGDEHGGGFSHLE